MTIGFRPVIIDFRPVSIGFRPVIIYLKPVIAGLIACIRSQQTLNTAEYLLN